jgi:hypothetical protein
MDEIDRIRRQLESQQIKAQEFFATLDPGQWQQQVYTSGSKWGVRQVLAHFISAERAFLRLIRNVLDDGPGAARDFDIDAFNEAETPPLSKEPIADLLTAFRQLRDQSISLMDEINSTDLDRVGFHPWFGDIEVRAMLKLVYRHNMIHMRDVRKALKAREPVPHLDIEAPTSENSSKG